MSAAPPDDAQPQRDAARQTSDVPASPATARDRVERRLQELDERPTGQHAELYEELHRDLQDALASAQQPTARP